MAYITWNTPVGSLGTIKELDYFEFPLNATSSNSESIEYTHISGNVPSGLRVSTDGIVKGVPVIQDASVSKTIVYTFTVRANTPSGLIADRTFNISITNFNTLRISERSVFISTLDDGRLITHQFYAFSESSSATLEWKIISGEVPIDIKTGEPMTLSSTGLFSGYISKLVDTTGQTSGYDMEPVAEFPYDFSSTSKDKSYVFSVQVTDGTNVDIIPVTVKIISKESFTADNEITSINNDDLPVDSDNKYPPIITTDPSIIPTLTAGNRFAFKFDAFDVVNDQISWAANSSMPNGLTLSSITGWMTGTIPSQVETEKTYVFGVYAYKTYTPDVKSLVLPVSITTVKNNTDNITWVSSSNIGTITNGSVSDLAISAVNNAGKELTYSLESGQSSLPQGLELLSNGYITGRCTFEYFSLDGNSANITVSDTTGITTGMTLEGPGVASGTQVLAVVDSYTVTISPATYVTEGAEITFTDGFTNIVTQLTDLSTTTTIDGGTTTFDCTFTFTVKAETIDNTVSSTKQFSIYVNNYNRAPYENLYLKAFPKLDQRLIFDSIMSNTDIFPDNLLYRSQDAWFGKATDIKMLFLPGLTASSLASFANSMQKNHYNKSINFGEVKTARAVDSNFNTKYEVVYLDVSDNNAGAALSMEPAITNNYLYGTNSYHTLYPNSFDNMTYRVGKGIGYANRGALPDWMTSPQEDGRVLGLTHAVVLAYTIPGASKLIAYRLKNNGITFNNIQFTADRYQVDAGVMDIYNPDTNKFINTDYVVSYIDHPVVIDPERPVDPQNLSLGYYLLAGTWVAIINPGKSNMDELVTREAIPGPQPSQTIIEYSDPEIGDKYLKFTQIGVYK